MLAWGTHCSGGDGVPTWICGQQGSEGERPHAPVALGSTAVTYKVCGPWGSEDEQPCSTLFPCKEKLMYRLDSREPTQLVYKKLKCQVTCLFALTGM